MVRAFLQRTALAVAIAALATACAPYRLGSALPAELRSVAVSVRNRTDEPGLDRTLPASVLREIQRDGSLRIAPSDSAARTRLEVTALETNVRSVSYERNDPLVPNEYRITVRARFRFVRTDDGAVVVKGTETGEATFPGTGDFASDKRRNLQAVCDDLSRRVLRKCAFAFSD